MYTTGTAFLEALLETGVEYVFANLGSDHTSIVEAYAAARRAGRKVPQIITAPHEMVAMTAAHGYAQVTGRAQAVVVHVECGTQSLAGAVHNAAKGRVPVFVFAGMSPATMEGEARGSRNEFIHWLQDVFDQRGLVRGYMRYDNEIRVGANVKQIVHRAMQFAHSEPRGPVYVTAPREIMEAEIPPVTLDRARWPAIAPAALPPEAPATIAKMLASARRPLVVTSYLGRNPAAVEELVRLCRRLGIGVLESVPNHLSYPHDDALYQGGQWNEKRQNVALAEADVILVVDSDVPWIPQINRPSREARIIHIDVDPLKQQMPLWYIGAEQVYRADAQIALSQINRAVESLQIDEALVRERRGHYERRHAERAEELRRLEKPSGDAITPEYLTACVGRAIGKDAIVLSEGVTNFHVIANHVGRTQPGTLMTSGGGSLGWNGGAAVGVKLARPDKFVAALTGDGTYMFSIPATVHWMAKRYNTPFLQVIYNNGGWRAPRFSAIGVHPQGLASQGDDIGISFEPPPDYAGIAAAAGNAHAERISRAEEVEPALERAVRAVREEGRCAVVDARV
ncbi:MAG: thiamine pyrophosphate-requiring protein [Steroidobacteraceae bacterium]|nr:thiamine pyrophosphate-requiring protein [Steroidobacteraceae bacterium]